MTEDPKPRRDTAKARIAIAKHLRTIEELALGLHAQALNTPNAKDFPGGTALHMLGPAASIAAWEAQYEATEEAERWDSAGNDRWANQPKLDPATYQGDDNEHPLNVLCFWTRVVREDREQPTALSPTISREIDYLRGQLDWICQSDEYGDPGWPMCFEMQDELRGLVRRMEDVLHEGDRIDTDAAPCFQLDAEGERCGGTLARVNLKPRPCAHATYAESRGRSLVHLLAYSATLTADHKQCDQGGRDDLYRCLSCEKNYTTTEYWLAVREHHERQAAG